MYTLVEIWKLQKKNTGLRGYYGSSFNLNLNFVSLASNIKRKVIQILVSSLIEKLFGRICQIVMNVFCKKEGEMTSKWDKIPSIPNLTVDWDYEPDTSLGKRLWRRLVQQDLQSLLGTSSTPVKMITADTEIKGRLVDISQKGLGVLLEGGLPVGKLGRVGFRLGKETIVSQAVTKNSQRLSVNHRVGLEFVGLNGKMEDYIAQLVSTDSYGQV